MSSIQKSSRRRIVAATASVALAASVVLAGCSFSGSTSPSSASTADSLAISMPNATSLDPAQISQGLPIDGLGLMEGLVTYNRNGTSVDPAASDRWKISPDKMTYTFHIRDSAKWSDGQSVTASDFAWTYKRMLAPGTGQSGGTLGADSYQISLKIKGAAEYLSGSLKDWSKVGIKALDAKDLQITLSSPNNEFLLGMAHPSMWHCHSTTCRSTEVGGSRRSTGSAAGRSS